ncbi:MAG: amidohydrolase [Reichenbachiella sp.]
MKNERLKSMYAIFLAIPIIFGSCNSKPSEVANSDNSIDNISIYYNGAIITMEGDEPEYVDAIVNQDDEIVFLGAKEDAFKKFPEASKIDLEGKTLLPGFIEPHVHPIVGAMMLQTNFVSPYDWFFPSGNRLAVKDRSALIKAIVDADKALKNPNAPLYLWGYQEEIQGQVDRATLDSINDNRSIVLIQYSQHVAYLNTPAIKHYGISEIKELENHPQWNPKNGKIEEYAWMVYLAPKFIAELRKPEYIKPGLLEMRDIIHLGGVTSIGDMATGLTRDPDSEIEYFSEAFDNEETPFRIRLTPDGKALGIVYNEDNEKVYEKVKEIEQIQTKHIYSNRSVKLFADGAFFAQNMQILPPGYNDGHSGEWIQQPEKLHEDIDFWYKKDYTIHIHTNGSGGLETILEKYEELYKTNPTTKDLRISIEHFGQSDEDQILRLKNVNGMVSASMFYLYTMGDIYSQDHVLGPDRGSTLVRIGDCERVDLPYTFHSDFQMAPLQPLLLAWVAVNRITAEGNILAPEQKISAFDAIQAITLGAAYNMHEEHRIGTLKVGKKADYVILQQNPLTINPMKIKDIKIIGTVFEGKSFPLD